MIDDTLITELFRRQTNEKEQLSATQETSASGEATNSEVMLIDNDAPGPSNVVTQKSRSTGTSHQSTMTGFVKQPTTKAQSEKITSLMTNVIVGDLRLINLVEGKHFKALINYLEPS